MKILVIEDDLRLSELLRYGLENEGFEVTVCCDGAEGLKCAMQNLSDMILLDRMLPEMSGEEVLKNLRREDVNTPVIFITALGEAAEKIDGLDLGADDYLVKPFDMGELTARIRSVMRRTLDQKLSFPLRLGNVSFLEKESKLVYGKQTSILSKKESELLSFFFRNPGQVLTRGQIIEKVWGSFTEIEDGNLDNYIYLLRKKLKALNTSVRIETIHRQGYCLTMDKKENRRKKRDASEN